MGWRAQAPGKTGEAGWASAVARVLRPADPRALASPLAVAQDELLDLAGGGLRQRPELDRIGALVVGQALAAERDDLLWGRRGAPR